MIASVNDKEPPVERKKPNRKRSQVSQKGIWTAVKDNAGLVAAIIALFGVLITGAINTYIATSSSNRNEEAQRELEEQRAQDAALQAYLDVMKELLLERHLRSSGPDSSLRAVANVQTLLVLERLDGVRKRAVLRLLNSSRLIEANAPIIALDGANLYAAELSGMDFSGTDLSGTDLRYADLLYVNLSDANLSGANLRSTDLTNANLKDANLSGANLTDADLRGANLRGTDISEEQLHKATHLDGATMPDGSKHP